MNWKQRYAATRLNSGELQTLATYWVKKKKYYEENPDEIPHGTVTGYSTGCKCDPCTVAQSNYNSNYKQEVLKEMELDPSHPFHGTTSGYGVGCRGPECKEAHEEARSEYKAKKLTEMQFDPDHKFHGTINGYQIGCKCSKCLTGWRDYQRSRSEKNKQQRLKRREDPAYLEEQREKSKEYTKRYRQRKKEQQ